MHLVITASNQGPDPEPWDCCVIRAASVQLKRVALRLGKSEGNGGVEIAELPDPLWAHRPAKSTT
jgi:hypothetical protein